MYWKKHLKTILLLVVIFLISACWASAEVNLTLTQTGGNVFVLQGSGFKNIAVIDLEFSFDAAAMEKPKAARGNLIDSGAIFDFKTAAPGEMRLFIRDSKKLINGSGIIAVFTFEAIDKGEGAISNIWSNLVSAEAAPVMARVRILGRPGQQTPPLEIAQDSPRSVSSSGQQPASPPIPPVPANQADTATQAQPATTAATDNRKSDLSQLSRTSLPGTTSAQVSSALGTVVFPGGQPDKDTPPPAAPPAETQPPIRPAPANQRLATDDGTPVSPAAPAGVLKNTSYKSVLEKFREYDGARTAPALAELFRPDPGLIIRQEPAVTLSDGENQVSLRIELPLNLKETPSFSLRKASMVSILQNSDGSWQITARPFKDTLEAGLTVICDGSEIRFPLTTAPPLKMLPGVTDSSFEYSFAEYLKKRGTDKDPRPDLNGDGKSDYIDDYIFTANYLVRQQNPKELPAGNKQQ